MIRAISVFLFGVLGAVSFACGQSAQTPVYFEIRPDNLGGAGTISNPYNGKTAGAPSGWASWFDYNMNVVTAAGGDREIILKEGVYETWGDNDGMGTNGFLLRNNTTLRGKGIGNTIIRLMGYSYGSGTSYVRSVVAAGRYGQSTRAAAHEVNYVNVSVRDLTVDCNAPSLFSGMLLDTNNSERLKHAIQGVQLSGSNCTIKNVEVTNTYRSTTPTEGDAISIGAYGVANASSNLIEDCVVRNCYGDKVFGIALRGKGGYTNSGVVRNNLVIGGAYSAYSAGDTIDSAYVNNTAQNVRFGFRYDQGKLKNTVFSGNVFMVWQGGFVAFGSNSSTSIEGVSLSNNTFKVDGTAPGGGDTASGVIHIQQSEEVEGLTISSNNFSAEDGRDALVFPGGTTYSGVSFTNNNIDDLTVSSSITSNITYVPLGSAPGGGVVMQGSNPTFGFTILKKSLDPGLRLQATDGGTNEKLLDFFYNASSKEFLARLLSDDGFTNANPWLTLKRTGASASRLDLGAQDTYLWNVVHIPNELRIDGGQMKIKEVSNGVMGLQTLASGTATISNTTVTTSSRIFVTRQSLNGSTRAGTLEATPASGSITIRSRKTDGTVDTADNSKVAWLVINPAP